MATTLRVHSLAKELGVPSKAVIEKCRAEGIELKNHMAAISIGLGESIREWFSSGDDVTSIETAEQVDVDLVRKDMPPKPEDIPEADSSAPPSQTAEAPVEAAPPEPVVLATPFAQPAETVEPALETAATVEPAAELAALAPEVGVSTESEPALDASEIAEAVTIDALSVGEAPQELAATAEVSASSEQAAPAEEAPTPEPPEPPAAIFPAGPQVVPVPAELRGPTVVRIEAPEPQRPLRPRSPRPAMPRGPLARGPIARGPGAAPPPTDAPPKRGRAKGTQDHRGGWSKSAHEEPETARAINRCGSASP